MATNSDAQPLHVLKPGVDIEKSDTMQPQADAATQKLFADTQGIVVKVRTKDGSGSGFFFDKEGHIATDAHVVTNEGQIDVVLANGKILPARLQRLDDINDVAVLKIDGGTPSYITVPPLIGDGEDPKADDHLWALGHPRSLDPIYISPGYYEGETTPDDIVHDEGPKAIAMAKGVLADMTPKELADAKAALARDVERVKMHLEPGNSGGPVINDQGKIVGLADMTDTDANSVVTPIDVLKDLMEDEHPKFTFSYSFVPAPLAAHPLSAKGEWILTDVIRADGEYRPPYADQIFEGGGDHDEPQDPDNKDKKVTPPGPKDKDGPKGKDVPAKPGEQTDGKDDKLPRAHWMQSN